MCGYYHSMAVIFKAEHNHLINLQHIGGYTLTWKRLDKNQYPFISKHAKIKHYLKSNYKFIYGEVKKQIKPCISIFMHKNAVNHTPINIYLGITLPKSFVSAIYSKMINMIVNRLQLVIYNIHNLYIHAQSIK